MAAIWSRASKWFDQAIDCLQTVHEKEPRDVTAKRYLRNSY